MPVVEGSYVLGQISTNWREFEWYRQNEQKLRQQYAGKVIAISNKKVLTEAASFSELFEHIHANHSDIDRNRLLLLRVPDIVNVYGGVRIAGGDRSP